MRKLNKMFLLTLTLVLAFSMPVLAFDLPDVGKTLQLKKTSLSTSDPDVARLIESKNFETMEVNTDNGKIDGKFASLEWINKSTYAAPDTQTKYQTLLLWFKIGEDYGWVERDKYITKAPPNSTLYERLSIDRESFILSFMDNTKRSRAEVESLIDSEEYLYTGAVIVAYNDYNLDGLADTSEFVDRSAMISTKEEIDGFARRYFGGNPTVISDLETRFQKVKLNHSPAPDFFSTPEGETDWQEHFLTNAKTYKGEIGEMLDIPITLHNIGSEAITDFGCTWYGAGWDKDKMVWKEEEIEVKQGEFTDFTVPVQVPNVGEETRLVFRANIDGKTPDTEVELENNITVITIQPDGLDLAVKLIPQKPFWEIPPDVGYTFPVVTIQGSINMENEMLFQADGFAEVEGIKRDDFLFVKARNEEPMTNSFGFKVTQPGIYKVKACIPAIDEYGNDIMFEFDMQEYKDINPANNCDELEVEVRIGDPRGTKPPEYKTPEYDGDDHFRIDLVG